MAISDILAPNVSVDKGALRGWLQDLEERVDDSILNAGTLVYATLADLNADLAHAANRKAEVAGDPTPANNGVYAKVGASGAGSWIKIADLGIEVLDERLDTAEASLAGKADISVTDALDTRMAAEEAASAALDGRLDAVETGKQPIDATLTSLAGLTLAANKGLHATGDGTLATHDQTPAARTLMAAVSAIAQHDLITTRGSGIPSAATTDLGAANAFFVDVQGTATITSLGTAPNLVRLVRFTSTATLVHSASLSLPGGADITTAAGDMGLFVSLGDGTWRLATWLPANGNATLDSTGNLSAAVMPDEVPVPEAVTDVWVEGFGTPQLAWVDNAGRVESAVDSAGREFVFSESQMVQKGRAERSFDLVIYGGTLSGIMAARRAKLRGLKVAIVDPYPRIGGAIVGGGLVATDFPSPVAQAKLVRGLTRQVWQTIHAYYDDPITARTYSDGDTQLLQFYDPRAFQRAVDLWAEGVDLIVSSSPIYSADDVRRRRDGSVSAIRSAVGWLEARVVIDASYEGDLIRAAEAPFRIGRESTGETGEPAAGFKPIGYGASYEDFTTPPDGIIVELGSSVAGLSPGDGDDRVQTLSIRSIVQKIASGGTPFVKPPGYNKADYLLVGEGVMLAGYTQLQKESSAGAATALAYQGRVRLLDGSLAIQTNNGTAGIVSNERGDFGTRYAHGNWATRREIVEAQARWQQGLYYYLANDLVSDWNTASTQALMADAQTWGMAPDLYPYSPWGKEWPEGVYVREALRLEAAYVMTQADLYAADSLVAPAGYDRGNRTNIKSDRVARWSYFLDAHACRIFEDPATPGRFLFEGGVTNSLGHEVDPYDIPFGAMRVPAVPNLLASVCIGCTHVAWMPTRMEPCYAMLGEAAGEAAALYCENNYASMNEVHGSIGTLQARLNEYGSDL